MILLDPDVLTLIVGGFILTQAVKYIYRLRFHPLARFPGPKVAAASSLYATYYNLIEGGAFTEKLPRLHDIYGESTPSSLLPRLFTRRVQGPIVRTHPNELHIRDIGSYNEIFRVGTPFDKESSFYGFPFEGSHFSMPDTKSAKKRRSLLQPHLSDKAIKQIQPVLERSINQFSGILQKASDEGSGVDLSLGYRSVTIDMLLRYGFGRTLKSLDDGTFNCRVAEDMDDVLFGSLIAKHFPKVGKTAFELLLQLPRTIAKMAKVSSILEMREVRRMLRYEMDTAA